MNTDDTPAALASTEWLGQPLPAPRLQLRWVANGDDRAWPWHCHYELVLPLNDGDIRREQYDEDGEELPERLTELVVPLKGATRRGGSGTPCTAQDGTRYCDAPYRDGSHAYWDAKVLGNPPRYVIAPDGAPFLVEDVRIGSGV